MTLEAVSVGPYSSFFIGDSLASGVELEEIVDINTADNPLVDEVQMQWFPGLKKWLQVGDRTVTVTLDFLSDSDLMFNLTKGLPVATTNKSATPSNGFYSILLLSNKDDDSSVFIPSCRTLIKTDLTRSKRNATTMQVILIAETANVYDGDGLTSHQNLIYYDTPDNLATIMAGQNPL